MKVVFLDRDGTIIKEPLDKRVDRIEKVELFVDSLQALKYLADNDFAAVIITNQAGVAEGRITEEEFWVIHNKVLSQLAPSGIKFLKTYMNGEGESVTSQWRKPGPKMLQQAAKDFNLKLDDIYMVGDNESDIQAAISAACKGGVLLETTHDNVVKSINAVYSASNLLDAAHYIVAHS